MLVTQVAILHQIFFGIHIFYIQNEVQVQVERETKENTRADMAHKESKSAGAEQRATVTTESGKEGAF